MARGATLAALLTALRAELRISVNPAHNIQVRDQQVYMLQRQQEMLWDDYTWPHLKVFRYLVPTQNQRYYDMAGCLKEDNTGTLVAAGDMKIDRVITMWIRDGSIWRPMTSHIDDQQFNAWNSDTGQTSWPPRRWAVAENDQIELWPIPGLTGDTVNQLNVIKVHGVRNLSPLVEDTDTADLDDRLLVLAAAGELMAGEDGKKKMALAQRRLMKIRGNATKIRRFGMYSDKTPERILRGPPTVYYRTT